MRCPLCDALAHELSLLRRAETVVILKSQAEATRKPPQRSYPEDLLAENRQSQLRIAAELERHKSLHGEHCFQVGA